MTLGKVEALKRLEEFQKSSTWSREQLAIQVGLDWNGPKWTRNFQTKEKAVVDEFELEKINLFLERKRFKDRVGETVNKICGISSDNMYFSLLDFFGYSYDTEKETKQLSSGLYTLYRPSLKIPDMFTVGLVKVYAAEETAALKVKETRIFKGTVEEVNHKNVVERGIKELFEGYMIRKRRRYICIQRSISRDSPNFVISVYNDEFVDNEGEGARILSLGGIVFGTVGSRIYVSRVFLERCEDGVTEEDMLNSLDYVKIDALKPSVRNYLKLSTPSDFFHVF